MPDISSIGSGPPEPPHRPGGAQTHRDYESGVEDTASNRPGDRVELSTFARHLDRLRHFPEVRMDRVEPVRQAIAEGRYETEDKLDIAVDRIIEEWTA